MNGDGEEFDIRFTDREVRTWGGLALIKKMLDSMQFREAASIWCGASRFAHTEVKRLDRTLTRLFGWTRVAGHKSIVRLFGRFDMLRHERVQAQVYRWFFDKINTEAALGFAMLAYNLMSLFRQAVMRARVQPTLATLHNQVLAVGASRHRDPSRNELMLSVPRRRRAWFEGLWSNAGHPPVIPVPTNNS